MIAIILSLKSQKRIESGRSIFHLSPIAMRLSRYAGATPGTGCCGDVSWRDIYRTGSCPPFELKFVSLRMYLPRKEVIQPHLPVRLPCYDFTPVMKPTVDAVLLAVKQTSSGEPHSHGVTGGVYKTRERIHRGILIRDY